MLNARAIKELVRQYNLGISPRRLGQHFLVDSKALSRIVAAIGVAPGDQILEIGAGLGALTEELMSTGATVHAVEKDPKFLRVLTERFKGQENLHLIHSDILRLDLAPLAQGLPEGLLVVGNIPYSLTSPILVYLLANRRRVKRVLLTIQKEVAQRVVAVPGTKAYSSITLLVAVAFKPSIAFTIHPGAFYPQPEVTSAVLRLDPLNQPVVPPEEEEGILRMIRLLFTHRRKTVLNCLSSGGFSLLKEEALEALKKAGFDPTRRPETFTLQELAQLYRTIPVNKKLA